VDPERKRYFRTAEQQILLGNAKGFRPYLVIWRVLDERNPEKAVSREKAKALDKGWTVICVRSLQKPIVTIFLARDGTLGYVNIVKAHSRLARACEKKAGKSQ
jgi:hypothetical protein